MKIGEKGVNYIRKNFVSDMREPIIIFSLGIFGFIGLGVFIGWRIWGFDAKYYKNLAESYKKKLTSQDVDVKEEIIRYLKNREIEIERDKDVVNKICKKHKGI